MGAALELDALPGGIEKADLPAASDERRGGQVALAGRRGRRDRAPGCDRRGLSLRRHRLDRLVLDRGAGRAVCLLADDDLPDRGVLLQA